MHSHIQKIGNKNCTKNLQISYKIFNTMVEMWEDLNELHGDKDAHFRTGFCIPGTIRRISSLA